MQLKKDRRSFIEKVGSLIGLLSLSYLGKISKISFAANNLNSTWDSVAYNKTAFSEALVAIGANQITPTDKINLKTPEIAENGAIVPLEITWELEATERIFVFAEKNPQPLVSDFIVTPKIEPLIATRIKMGESALVHVVALAAGSFYLTSKEVKVTIGGCGEE